MTRTQVHRDRDLAEGRIEELRAVVRDLTTVLEKRNAALLSITKVSRDDWEFRGGQPTPKWRLIALDALNIPDNGETGGRK